MASMLGRLFRFRLRSLLLLTAVASFVLAGWSVWIRPYVGQQAALAELSRLGASTTTGPASAPDWVKSLVGEENFIEVYSVDRVGAAGDGDLAHLHQLVFLQQLNLASANVTDQVGTRLGGLLQLRSLNLGKTKITDQTVKRLGQLTRLESLNLRYVAVTDESAAALGQLRSMRRLQLTGAELGDASIESLAQLHQLEDLYIRWTRITPAGAERLQELLPEANIHYVERPAKL